MNTEWMPINPCKTCTWKGNSDCPADFECKSYHTYLDEKESQKKLLGYLIAHFWGKDETVQNILRQMKSQLEKER